MTSEALRGVVSLEILYRFVEEHKDGVPLRIERTPLGKQYCKLCEDLTNSVVEAQGFYLWGRYDKKGLWYNVYLGMAGYRENKKNLRKRILEELKDERPAIWAHIFKKQELRRRGEEIHPIMWTKRKYSEDWERSMQKAGATHIVDSFPKLWPMT